MSPAERHAEEALANAMAHLAVDLARDAIAAYDHNRLEVGVVLATIVQASGHANRALLTGWDFHSSLKADQW